MLKTRNWSEDDERDDADDPGIAIAVPEDRPELDDQMVRPEMLDTPPVPPLKKRGPRNERGA